MTDVTVSMFSVRVFDIVYDDVWADDPDFADAPTEILLDCTAEELAGDDDDRDWRISEMIAVYVGFGVEGFDYEILPAPADVTTMS